MDGLCSTQRLFSAAPPVLPRLSSAPLALVLLSFAAVFALAYWRKEGPETRKKAVLASSSGTFEWDFEWISMEFDGLSMDIQWFLNGFRWISIDFSVAVWLFGGR